MLSLIVTGTLAFDYIMDFSGRFADRIMPDKIHKISLSFLVDKLSKQFGGTAGNIAYTIKLLGSDPIILSSAGNDFAPYEAYFQNCGISTKYISQHSDVATSSYFVVTDQEDNQIGSFFVGATQYAKDASLFSVINSGNPKDSRNFDKGNMFVVISPTDPTAMKKYVKECQQNKLKYLYDPAFQIATFTPEELRSAISTAEILIGNDYEMELIQKKLNVTHSGLTQMIPVVITTLGSKGSTIESRMKNHESRIMISPAKPKNTSDPTGAGDAYRAGFLAGYSRGFDLETCGKMGSIAAVYTVEKYGTQTHTFTKQEFIKRYKENYGTMLSL